MPTPNLAAPRRATPLVAVALAGLALAAVAPRARAAVAVGDTLDEVVLPGASGRTEPLVVRRAVNVVLFWRPGQEHSTDTLKQMAACGVLFAARVHAVTVASGMFPLEEVRASGAAAGPNLPVLLDVGDQLYGKLQIRQHPVVLVADGKGKVALAQPYVRLRYCEIVSAHVRRLLGEIDEAQLEAALHPSRASFPDDDRNNVARRYVNMGRREAAAGRCDRALASFGKALEIAPGDADARAGVAGCEGGKAGAGE